MSGLNEFMANLGFGRSSAQRAAQGNVAAATAAYQGLAPPTLKEENPQFGEATEEGASNLGNVSVNPAYNAAQMQSLSALQNLANHGGRNAAMDANLAQITQQENANAAGQRGAVMQNAAARGISGGGAELLAQLNANQNAQTNANNQGMNLLGQEANTALQASQGAANIGSNMENQDYAQQANRAQANDAINRFNAQNKMSMSQYNAGTANQAQQYNTGLQEQGYQNQYGKAQGVANVNLGAANFNQNMANMGAQQTGNLMGGLIKLGTAGATPTPAGATPTPNVASGGRIPGTPLVSHDSTLNDIVPIKASPGEVVVPRSIVSGSPKQITNFVKNPPMVGQSSNKETMLSALKNIRNRRNSFL